MKERSREMGSSPPTAEEIFRDYCAPRTDVVHSLTNEREDVSSRVFCFIPFLSSKKLIAASQTLFLSRTAIPGAAAAQRQGLQRRRFVKPSLLKQISNDETCKEEAATGPTYRD